MRRILFLARAEVLHVVRDRATLAQVLLLPIIQLLILSNAATFQIRGTPLFVRDLDRTSVSRDLVRHFAQSGHFSVVGQSASPAIADDFLLRGDATMVLTIPDEFESSLVRTGTAPVQLVINAEKGSAAGIVQSYAARILSGYSNELNADLRPTFRTVSSLDEAPPSRGVATIDVSTRGWYNPELNYRHYMVPGILVALVTLIGTLMTAQNVAREKELGTLEQLNVTPITRSEFIAGKLLPFWVLAQFEFAVGLALGHFVFGVPIRGSLLLLFGVASIYLIAALSIGLWISTLVDTQQQAMFVTFFIMVVYMLMSGLYTPIDSMPVWVQKLAELNPVKHFVLIARAVLIKGAGLREILKPLLILVAFAGGVFTFAVRQYSKRSA